MSCCGPISPQAYKANTGLRDGEDFMGCVTEQRFEFQPGGFHRNAELLKRSVK